MRYALYREPTPAEREVFVRRRKLATLQRIFAERELALGDLRGQLLSFEGRYLRQVGLLYKELDEWQRKRNELHARPGDTPDFSDIADVPLAEQRAHIAQTVRALFREVAKRLHPDFAADAEDEQRRTRLMAQANDAARRGDRLALERMLRGFDAVLLLNSEQAIEAELEFLAAQISELHLAITQSEKECVDLDRSEMAELQRACITAALEGRDLLAEMAVRVKGLIGIAMRQYELDLDKIKNPPRGALESSLLSAETNISFRFVNGKRQQR
ncbi:hypothetical protein ACFQBQ_15765 [Granulicella cerasi]|uniref:J domain-containing protein n=1 Tax=Granulicella cerasi TaxID=741063 RepID=A0ABW1ZC60_9BACT|nr:hypothetical protein [Granulicella cerasi]